MDKPKDLLENLMNKNQSNILLNRANKKGKVTNNHGESVNVITALYNALINIHKIINNTSVDKSKIEVEIRVGMIICNNSRWQHQTNTKQAIIYDENTSNQLEFKSGIDYIFISRHLSKILTSENDFVVLSTSKQTIRSNSSNIRWEVDRQTNTIRNLEKKERLFRWSSALLSHEYDIRIDAASEIQLEDNDIDYTMWSYERTKQRTTYKSVKFPYWKIDITEVDITIRLPNKPIITTKEYEFEIEMLSTETFKWLSLTNELEYIQLASKIAENLELLIDFCIPSIANSITTNTFESCKQFLPYIYEMNKQLFKLANYNNDFVGCMPYNITRNGLNQIVKNNYYITEKSDGVRYLFYIITIHGITHALLMNRNKELYELTNNALITKYFQHGCIFDCEIVYNLTLKENLLLVFDILAYDNVSLINKPFHERLRILDNDFKRKCDDIIKQSGNHTSIIINRKKYNLKQDMLSLLSKFKYENGEHIYIEANRNRHHKTDGIIFQPADSNYKLYNDSDLMKWKWYDLRTVDLLVRISNDGRIVLYCLGPDNSLIDCSKRNNTYTGFGNYDQYRLLADYNQYIATSQQSNCIIEVMYDINVGHWKYFKIRSDKSKPNFIDVILSIYLEQAEDITIFELEYAITLTSNRKSFHELIEDKMKRLVEEIRSENYKKRKQQELALHKIKK